MRDRQLMILGDAHAAGLGDPVGIGWTGRIQRRCEDRGLGFAIADLSSATASSLELLDSWTHQMPPPVLAGGVSRALVSFGVSDAADWPGRASRVQQRRSAMILGVLLDEMTAKGIAVYVVGPAPVSDPDHCERIRSLSASFAPICEERQVPYTSVFELLLGPSRWMTELEQGDGIHPASAGYELLGELLVEAGLVDWLCRPLAQPQGLPGRRGRAKLGQPEPRDRGAGDPHLSERWSF